MRHFECFLLNLSFNFNTYFVQLIASWRGTEKEEEPRVKHGGENTTALLNAHSVHSDCLSSIGWGDCDAPTSSSRGIGFILNEGFGGVVFFFFGGVVPLQLVGIWQVSS